MTRKRIEHDNPSARFCDELDFDDFLKEKGISWTDPRVPLLKEVWNQAVASTCSYFGGMEGTDHGTEEEFKEP